MIDEKMRRKWLYEAYKQRDYLKERMQDKRYVADHESYARQFYFLQEAIDLIEANNARLRSD